MKDPDFVRFAGTHHASTHTEYDESEEISKKEQLIMSQNLIEDEDRAVSVVRLDVLWDYVKATGSVLNLPLLLILYVIVQINYAFTGIMLAWWVSDHLPSWTDKQYIAVYAGFIVLSGFFPYGVGSFTQVVLTRASNRMARDALYSVFRAPCSFFDTQPLGRINSRFEGDVAMMDNYGVICFKSVIENLANLVGILVLVSCFFPYFVIVMVPLYCLVAWMLVFSQASARELRRISTLRNSHVLSRIQEGVSGTATVKAYGQQERFITGIFGDMDILQSGTMLESATQAWLMTVVNSINAVLVLCTALFVVSGVSNINPAVAAFVLAQAISIVSFSRRISNGYVDVEKLLHATERVHYYSKSIEHEAALETDVKAHANWPEKGQLTFESISLRYRPELPHVLKDFSLKIKSGEKVGIVGRTAAGKSSLIVALFRMVELSQGKILLDDIDVANVGLETLRSRISIIPQDPLLFEGDIRRNLDPFGRHSDEELLDALCQVQLTEKVSQDGDAVSHVEFNGVHLSDPVRANGDNISHGQRQQLSLGRALLNHSNLVLLDEATSNIDPVIDAMIQDNIMKLFAKRTVISVAHRLKSVIGFDTIVVLDVGKLVETGPPLELFEKRGLFRSMCEKSGLKRRDIENARRR